MQSSRCFDPAKSVLYPTGHSLQDVLPSVSIYCPIGHSLHEFSASSKNIPLGQGSEEDQYQHIHTHFKTKGTVP